MCIYIILCGCVCVWACISWMCVRVKVCAIHHINIIVTVEKSKTYAKWIIHSDVCIKAYLSKCVNATALYKYVKMRCVFVYVCLHFRVWMWMSEADVLWIGKVGCVSVNIWMRDYLDTVQKLLLQSMCVTV